MGEIYTKKENGKEVAYERTGTRERRIGELSDDGTTSTTKSTKPDFYDGVFNTLLGTREETKVKIEDRARSLEINRRGSVDGLEGTFRKDTWNDRLVFEPDKPRDEGNREGSNPGISSGSSFGSSDTYSSPIGFGWMNFFKYAVIPICLATVISYKIIEKKYELEIKSDRFNISQSVEQGYYEYENLKDKNFLQLVSTYNKLIDYYNYTTSLSYDPRSSMEKISMKKQKIKEALRNILKMLPGGNRNKVYPLSNDTSGISIDDYLNSLP